MLLSGYGVELAIKSTEYKAVDDTKVKGQFVTRQFLLLLLLFLQLPKSIKHISFLDSKTDINAEEDEDDEVQGFFFGTLK